MLRPKQASVGTCEDTLTYKKGYMDNSSTYFDRFLRMHVRAECPGCARSLPLQAFRKWWGSKRTLRTLCAQCEPERAVTAMTPDERLSAMENQRPYATPARVTRLNEREAQASRRRRSTSAVRRHSRDRTQAWAPVLHALRKERDWCRGALLKLRAGAGAAALDGAPPWAAFFSAYETALNEALRLAMLARNNRTQPRPEELAQPVHAYLHDGTLATLRALYGRCSPIRGRALYRDPQCLRERELRSSTGFVDKVSTKEKA